MSTVEEWLRHGGPWGEVPAVVETHAAAVFLVGERAFKWKKPVDFGYLDFSTATKRHDALSNELRLNKRTAPSTYVRLVPIFAHGDTYTLAEHGPAVHGPAVDWLLEMARFPDGALLAQRADRGLLDEATIEELARHAAAFHDEAGLVTGYDWPQATARIARENTTELRALGPVFGAHDVEAAIAMREAAHRSCASALAAQSADVRHCHGDMHLGNAFLDRGQPTLFDCIEFDDFYATIPPLYDLSYLLMDLIARGMRRHANRALNIWAISRRSALWSTIMDSLAALPLYLAMRAEIRAKVEARRPGGAASAQRYLALTPQMLASSTAQLIAIGGLSGTGKSSLAKAMAWQVGGAAGAVHLRSDELRKRLAGTVPTARLPPESYTAATSERVYDELLRLAKHALAARATVIVDAVFARQSEREAIEAAARAEGVPFNGLWLEAPAEVLRPRLAQRTGDASDADIAVLERQFTYDLGAIRWHRLNAAANAAAVERSALTLVAVTR